MRRDDAIAMLAGIIAGIWAYLLTRGHLPWN